MSVALILSAVDTKRIDALKKPLGVATRIEVVRAALGCLERQTPHDKRVRQWERAVRIVALTSRSALDDFGHHSRMHRTD